MSWNKRLDKVYAAVFGPPYAEYSNIATIKKEIEALNTSHLYLYAKLQELATALGYTLIYTPPSDAKWSFTPLTQEVKK